MDSQNVNVGLDIITAIVATSVVVKANPAIRDFFTSGIVVFIVVTLAIFKQTKNIYMSLAGAFFATIIIQLIVEPEFIGMIKESFDLIYPTPGSSPNCSKVTAADLQAKFGGNLNKLKEAMISSQVPLNTELNDLNSPLISTYLVNNPTIGSIGGCKLIV
jgi:hypothetical protein